MKFAPRKYDSTPFGFHRYIGRQKFLLYKTLGQRAQNPEDFGQVKREMAIARTKFWKVRLITNELKEKAIYVLDSSAYDKSYVDELYRSSNEVRVYKEDSPIVPLKEKVTT